MGWGDTSLSLPLHFADRDLSALISFRGGRWRCLLTDHQVFTSQSYDTCLTTQEPWRLFGKQKYPGLSECFLCSFIHFLCEPKISDHLRNAVSKRTHTPHLALRVDLNKHFVKIFSGSKFNGENWRQKNCRVHGSNMAVLLFNISFLIAVDGCH